MAMTRTAPVAFNGQLNQNTITNGLFNAIIRINVNSENIRGTFGALVDKARVDAGLYGDSVVYYDTDVLNSKDWLNDAEAKNLLELHRPTNPLSQRITIDQFRQIAVTIDNYLSKQAFGDEGTFSQFQTVIVGWMTETKRVYDSTIYNTFIGTEVTKKGKQYQVIDLSKITETGEEKNRLEAETIAQSMADIITDLEDISRDYTDNGFLKSQDVSKLIFVWNKKWVNKIEKRDLPTMFHKEGLVDKLGENVLPSRYFGDLIATDGTAPTNNTTVRSTVEIDYNTVARNAEDYDNSLHIFAGDLIPSGKTYKAYEAYKENDKIMCKIMASDSVPYMSAFEVSTSFYNPKSLTENKYLTFGYNTLQHLASRPFITLEAKLA